MPAEFNGRVERLYVLRDRYDNAVANSAGVAARGLTLARAQRQFNLQLATYRREAEHRGVAVGLPTQVPANVEDFMSLMLVEHRRMADAQETLARIARHLVGAHSIHTWHAY